MLDTGSAVL
jgi:hypothetical protein